MNSPEEVRVRLRRLGALLVAAQLSACSADELLRGDEWIWVWLVTPLVMLLSLGGLYVQQARARQFADWRLDQQPTAPSARPIIVRVVVAASTSVIVFGAYNAWIEFIDPRQLALNVSLWLMGSFAGACGALYLGFKLSEPRHSRRR